MRMMFVLLAGACAIVPVPALAQQITPLLDTRLRYETVDQNGLDRTANALTLRVRGGAEFSSGDWKLLAEGEATVPLDESYDSGVNRRTRYPLVADPANGEINRLQLQYRGISKALVTLGRQRINLDDQRFVGASGWRQNEQTFDAARVEYSGIARVKADVTYAWSDRTIWGMDGRGARQQAIGGDNLFANLAYVHPWGTLTGFAYWVDQDERAVQSFRLSSRTFGARFAGTRPVGKNVKLSYAGSYARQSDFHRNPEGYSADYFLLDGKLDIASLSVGAGYEVLGADNGRPLTSFQTPLATLHKFQGWADKFLTTPPNGVRDLYASAGYSWKKLAGLDGINAGVTWHRFRSDRLDMHYGSEWDAILSAKRGRLTATAKLADYDARAFATDTRKAWLQLEWAY
jgi:hypothetical protein